VRSVKWLFFSLLLAVSFFTGCTPPIGYIGGGGNGEKLVAVPYRMVYNINKKFQRDDVAVFISSGGELQPVPDEKDIKFSIIEDPDFEERDKKTWEVPDDGYVLQYSGRKTIVINYKDLNASYSIEVQDPDGVGGEYTDPDSIHMGNGGIKWEYPGRN